MAKEAEPLDEAELATKLNRTLHMAHKIAIKLDKHTAWVDSREEQRDQLDKQITDAKEKGLALLAKQSQLDAEKFAFM